MAVAVVFYNKTIFEELGLVPPQSFDELFTLVETLRQHGIVPFALANREKWPASIYYMYLVDRIGGSPAFHRTISGNTESFGDPVFVEAGEYLQKLVQMDAFNSDFMLRDYGSSHSRPLFYEGRAAMELASSWTLSMIRKENPEFYSEHLDFFPFPSFSGKENPAAPSLMGSYSDGFYSISSFCTDPGEAFALLQMVA